MGTDSSVCEGKVFFLAPFSCCRWRPWPSHRLPKAKVRKPTGCYGRSGSRLGPAASARSSRRSSSGPGSWLACGGAGHGLPSAVLLTACCTATARVAHHSLVQEEVAAARSAGGARWARTRAKVSDELLRCFVPAPAYLGAEEPCGPPDLSTGYPFGSVARQGSRRSTRLLP